MISQILSKKLKNKKSGKRAVGVLGGSIILVLIIAFGAAVYMGYIPFSVNDSHKPGHVVTKQVKGVVQDYADWTTATSGVVAFYKPGTTERVDSCTSDGTTGVFTTALAFTSDDKYDIFISVSGYYHSFYPNTAIPRVSDPTDDYIVFDDPFFITDQTSESDLTLAAFNSAGTEVTNEATSTDWDVDGTAHNILFISMTIATDGNALGSAPGVSTWDPTETPEAQYDDVVLVVRFNSSSTYPDDHSKVLCETPGWVKVTTGSYTYFIYKLPAFVYSTHRNMVATMLIEVTFDFTANTADASSLYLILEDNVDFATYCAAPGADSDHVAYDTSIATDPPYIG